jgi:hypothetical protein
LKKKQDTFGASSADYFKMTRSDSMAGKHKLEFTDDEFETLHILINGGIQKLEAMPRVDLMEPSRKSWLKIMKNIKRILWAESPQQGLQLGGLQFGCPAHSTQSTGRRKQAS